jgi:cytochrome c biogenesis protein CcmG/thiol:disulfide interchange protein DsbE
MKKLWLTALPLFLFLGFVALGIWGLGADTSQRVSSTGRSVPAFRLPLLHAAGAGVMAGDLTEKDIAGWRLVNFFASWCAPCLAEHAFLKSLPAENLLRLGIGYKDTPEALSKYFDKNGNPYQQVAVDREGQASLDWGVTGVPETFLVSPEGKIAAHYSGPLTPEVWMQYFAPVLEAKP